MHRPVCSALQRHPEGQPANAQTGERIFAASTAVGVEQTILFVLPDSRGAWTRSQGYLPYARYIAQIR